MGEGSLRNMPCPCGSNKKYKNCCMGKVFLQNDELLEKLKIQIKLLKIACKNYDDGFMESAITIATHLRTLLHNGRTSSLLTKLAITRNKFLTSVVIDARQNFLPTTALLITRFRDNKEVEFIPKLDELKQYYRYISFDTWWKEEIVILDNNRNEFSREDLILLVADTDGGAHQDDGIEKDYWFMANDKNAILQFSNTEPKNSPCYPTIRQIAHELLCTLNNIGLDSNQ